MRLSIKKLVCIESKVHGTIFNIKEDSLDAYKKYRIRAMLTDVEEILSEYGFIRGYKSF